MSVLLLLLLLVVVVVVVLEVVISVVVLVAVVAVVAVVEVVMSVLFLLMVVMVVVVVYVVMSVLLFLLMVEVVVVVVVVEVEVVVVVVVLLYFLCALLNASPTSDPLSILAKYIVRPARSPLDDRTENHIDYVIKSNKLLYYIYALEKDTIKKIIIDLTDKHNCLKNDGAVLEIIFILRIIRIFRIFHMMRHYKAMPILLESIRASRHELMMLSIFLLITMVIFATLMFFVESIGDVGGQNQFTNIPIGFWWSIVTMTTVGYGDITPRTLGGYFIGVLCAVWGVLLVALTIPVISGNFVLFYTHARTREQLVQQDRLRGHLCAHNGRPRDVVESQTEVEMTRPLINADIVSQNGSETKL
ncbi:hypothetical protein LSAT2_005430 [Lamellibrachia satsuma]|nr:hypothetical protein LSAT2_005430 [Lamellibrachia satsuma]